MAPADLGLDSGAGNGKYPEERGREVPEKAAQHVSNKTLGTQHPEWCLQGVTITQRISDE